MAWEVRKRQGGSEVVVAGHADEAEAKTDAMTQCTSRDAEFIVYDAGSHEVGRAIFSDGQAGWVAV